MKHYDEDALESFAIGSESVAGQREEFEQHIKECSSCRDFYNEMVQFYQQACGGKPLLTGQKRLESKTSLIRIPQYIVKSEPREIMPLRPSLPSRIGNYIKTNPVKSTASFLVVTALFVFTLNINTFLKDNNPAYLKRNDANSTIEIFNKNNEKLWQKTCFYGQFSSAKEKRILINDLDFDGKNEIITTIPFAGEFENISNILQVYDYKGRQKFIKKFILDSITFRGTTYITGISAQQILIDEFIEKGKKEILVSGASVYSPQVIYRIDSYGNILGEYWHYGGFLFINPFILKNETKKAVLICGYNNVNHKGFISVIDPVRITGKTESSQTAGFGFPTSKAEIFYIALPNPKEMMESELLPYVYPEQVYDQENVFKFTWRMDRSNEYSASFNYYFAKDIKLLDVKPTSHAELYYLGLVQKRRIKKYSEEKLTEELKNGILYWDGKGYRKEWTKVNLPPTDQ